MNPQNPPPFRSDRNPLEAPSLYPRRSSGATILLAEDDDGLRSVLEYSLVIMGFSVVACADACIALAAFRVDAGVDLLLTDLIMPGMSGMQLAREVTVCKPTLPVLLLTGSILSADDVGELVSRGWAYMSKPCTMTNLEDTLRRLMSGTAGPHTRSALLSVDQETVTN